MIKLYYAPNSIALAPHIALCASGLAYELDLIDHSGDKTTSNGRSYFDISPAGYVPALEMADGDVLTESSAILQYIADTAPDSGLCGPIGSSDRYKVLQWVHFVSTELHQKIMRLTLPGVVPEYFQANVEQVRVRFRIMDARLANREFFVGDTFTIADAFVFVAVRWWLNKVDIADYPNVGRFMQEIAQRPAVLRALAEEGIA